jgi:superfamily II DNA or RNA helicase
MSNLFVSKKNEAFVQISTDFAIAQELSEYFAFFVPGYQYQPLFKSGTWDGKVRLFDRRYNSLPSGLIGYLQKFAQDRAYTISIDDAVLLTTNYSIAEAQDFAQSLKLPHVPHDYQIEAFVKAIRYRRLLIVSPTASGKSLLIYIIVRQLQQNHQRGVLIVPTTSLVEQMFSDFKSYGWDSDKYVHRLYEGKDKVIHQFLTVSTYQSLYLQHKKNPEYLSQFDFVIGDEAHQFKAKTLSTVMANLKNADVRIGTTGTLDGTKTHKLVLEGHFGPEFAAVTTKQLMDSGKLATLKIKCLILKYPEAICQTLRKSTYQEEYDAVVHDVSRAKFIRNLALSLHGNTLILFQLVQKHGKPMYQAIRDGVKDGRSVFFVSGDTETMVREEIRGLTEESENAIIVASYGTFSTGINIKKLHNVIFAAPSKSRIRNLQSIGRGLRNADGKTHATLFDIVDDLRIGKHENFLLKHFIHRAEIYNSEKLPFKQYLVDLAK